MSKCWNYSILYSLIDDKTGEVIAENEEVIIESTWNVLAMAKLQLQVNKKHPTLDVLIVLHRVRTVEIE